MLNLTIAIPLVASYKIHANLLTYFPKPTWGLEEKTAAEMWLKCDDNWQQNQPLHLQTELQLVAQCTCFFSLLCCWYFYLRIAKAL